MNLGGYFYQFSPGPPPGLAAGSVVHLDEAQRLDMARRQPVKSFNYFN